MSQLTDTDHAFFADNGYLKIENAVPVADCEAVIAACFEFLSMDRNNPDDWYRDPLHVTGMIEMYQHQALWNNRQNPRLYEIFAELLGNEKLWVSFDRASLKPPSRPDQPRYNVKGFLHWDMDLSRRHTIPFGVQGVLYLVGTTAEMGGFQCAPGHHKQLEEWVAKHGEKNVVPHELYGEVNMQPIPGRAGDFVIWDRRLLHGNGHNVSDKPRMAQYITYYPPSEDEDRREDRIRRWRDRLSPEQPWAKGDPRRLEEMHGTTAELTPLGRKLLGLDTW